MRYTHTGLVHNKNFGQPIENSYSLRETNTHWIAPDGRKYRKTDGAPAGAATGNQIFLLLETVKEIL